MSKKLEGEVWNIERCAGCGACVTACSKRILRFEDGSDHPHKKTIMKKVGFTDSRLDVCHFCEMEGVKLCELSCPRLQEEWPDGPVIKKVLVRTHWKKDKGDTNRIVSNLLIAAMQSGMIDGAVISDVDRWTLVPKPRVATSISDLVESVGHQYIWKPTLEGLKEAIYEKDLKNIAVVGEPCNIQALDRIEGSGAKALEHLSDRIKLKVGLFCSGVYRVEALNEISEAIKVPLSSIKSISVEQGKDRLEITTFDGKKKHMKVSEATNLIRAGCGRCYDLLSEMSDISIGPIGAKEGYATAIVRTAVGENILENAIGWSLLEVKEGVDEKVLEGARAAKKKRKRAEMMDNLQILMLEALRDPSKIEEAKKKFGEVYYKEKGGQKKGDHPGKDGCGTCSMC